MGEPRKTNVAQATQPSQGARVENRIVSTGTTEALTKAVNDRGLLNTFVNLMDRWQDEWQYEDFDDYAKVMGNSVQKILGRPISNVEGKEPIIEEDKDFGIEFDMDNGRYGVYARHKGGNTYAMAYRKIK